MIIFVILGFCVFFQRDVETLKELEVWFFNQLLKIFVYGWGWLVGEIFVMYLWSSAFGKMSSMVMEQVTSPTRTKMMSITANKR